MYNLSVQLVASYFVGDGQWLVHNVERYSLPDAFEKALHLANVNRENSILIGRINFYYDVNNPRNAKEIIEVRDIESSTYGEIEQRFRDSTYRIPRQFSPYPEGGNYYMPRRISLPTSNPGVVGTIHIYDTFDGAKGVALHHATKLGYFDPHLHAIEPKVDISADDFVKALARADSNQSARYSPILLPDGDHHIYCKYK